MASEKPFVTLLREYRSKTRDALEVFLYSARKLPPFDIDLLGSPDAMEPYRTEIEAFLSRTEGYFERRGAKS